MTTTMFCLEENGNYSLIQVEVNYYERLLKDSITESYTGYLGVKVFLIKLCLVLRQDIKCSKKWSSLVKGCTNDGF